MSIEKGQRIRWWFSDGWQDLVVIRTDLSPRPYSDDDDPDYDSIPTYVLCARTLAVFDDGVASFVDPELGLDLSHPGALVLIPWDDPAWEQVSD